MKYCTVVFECFLQPPKSLQHKLSHWNTGVVVKSRFELSLLCMHSVSSQSVYSVGSMCYDRQESQICKMSTRSPLYLLTNIYSKPLNAKIPKILLLVLNKDELMNYEC